jgi:hypothetical protein
MLQKFSLVAVVVGLCAAGYIAGQDHRYSEMGRVAQQVIEKYEHASCREIAATRSETAASQQSVIGMLHGDADMRRKFLNRVATPVAKKLFECGLIS